MSRVTGPLFFEQCEGIFSLSRVKGTLHHPGASLLAGALADMFSARKVISLITGVISSQLICPITNLLITKPSLLLRTHFRRVQFLLCAE